MRLLAAAAVASLALTGCGSDEPDPGGIAWNTYSDDLLAEINTAWRAGDCVELRKHLAAADASSDAHQARYGEGNGDLLGYIDDVMRDAGCYD